MTRDDIVNRFISELTTIAGAALETSASTRAAHAPGVQGGGGFVATIEAREGQHGTLRVYFGRTGAEALALAMKAPTADATTVIGILRDLCSQVTASLDRRAVGAELVVAMLEEQPDGMEALPARVVEIVLKGHEQPLHVALAGDLEFPETADGKRAARSKTLDVIMDIDLPLVVRFGRTELPLKALTTLGPGSVIDLGRSPEEPVDILISNRVVARGEVVIVAGNYGVRVRDVVSPAERARSLEGELV